MHALIHAPHVVRSTKKRVRNKAKRDGFTGLWSLLSTNREYKSSDPRLEINTLAGAFLSAAEGAGAEAVAATGTGAELW